MGIAHLAPATRAVPPELVGARADPVERLRIERLNRRTPLWIPRSVQVGQPGSRVGTGDGRCRVVAELVPSLLDGPVCRDCGYGRGDADGRNGGSAAGRA